MGSAVRLISSKYARGCLAARISYPTDLFSLGEFSRLALLDAFVLLAFDIGNRSVPHLFLRTQFLKSVA